MKRGAYIEKYADIVALLVKAPRTTVELANLSGVCAESTRRFVNALEAEGVVNSSWVGNSRVPRVFEWAPAVGGGA